MEVRCFALNSLTKRWASRGTSSGPFAKGRKWDREDIQPVEEVFSKFAFFDRLKWIAIGRNNHAHVEFEFVVAAEPSNLPIGKDTKQLGLQGHRHFGNFVEEQCSPVRLLKTTGAGSDCPCKRSPFVTEDLAFDQSIGYRGRVDRNKRLVCSCAQLMDRPCHEFFAGPAFAGNDHGNIAARNHFNEIEDFPHRFACADELPGQAFRLNVR